ncbi:MAG: GNAT family N-acetyltransferase [Bacillota bacterium]|nr:GNAT family N-acetyltransferase [Bacillota bacterium]
MWTVEYATTDDVPSILNVQRSAFSENQRRYRFPLPQLRETEEDLLRDLREAVVLVARQADEVIGAVRGRLDGEVCEVYDLAVDPAYSHLAVGRSLMSRVEAEALGRGATRVVLRTGLRDAPAIDFYLKLGYRPTTVLRDDLTEYDQVEFVKVLAE